ncbi:hypothetical protein B0H14DRAFT_2891179 [Mycena olivaceomarginata]|nr:hypothetical protein B0H14DRAFT_2891179 [Mycena olivaceomarginata]
MSDEAAKTRKTCRSLSSHPPLDLDDVLSQTNLKVAQWHNEKYGTQMDLSTFYCNQNPFWGTPQETFEKVAEFYRTDSIFHAIPVPGAREGIQSLKDMGYKTGMFANVVFTGQFKNAQKLPHNEVLTNLTKSGVCADLKAQVLIDDSAENAIQCSTASSPTRVLLFGDYEWNKRISGPGDGRGRDEFWKEDMLVIPDGVPLERVKIGVRSFGG